MNFRSPAPLCLSFAALVFASGCGRPSLIPNSDPALRKSSTAFSADAAKRHPFNPDLPSGGEAVARAQVGYSADTIEVLNASNGDWDGVELWVNRRYVVFVPRIKAKAMKTLNFQMFFDDNGRYFPVNNGTPARMVQQLEMVRDGRIYSIPVRLAD